jgi:hypothetical protein
MVYEQKRFHRNSSIVYRPESDDWALLFDLNTGATYGLNDSGSFIWSLLENDVSIHEIIEKMAGMYDIKDTISIDDINEFLEDLVSLGFVTSSQ